MIPPGLAYCAVSERAWQRMESTKNPRYYFDLRKERKNAAKGESSFTPAIALIAALGAALNYLREAGGGDMAAGRDALIANAELAAEMTRAAAGALGLGLFAQAPASAALTAIVPPAGLDSGVIVKAFRERFNAVIANGQGDNYLIKTNRRMERFKRRGLAAVRSEWRFITATHNLLKLQKAYASLKVSEHQFTKLFYDNHLMALTVSTLEGKFLQVNEIFLYILGASFDLRPSALIRAF